MMRRRNWVVHVELMPRLNHLSPAIFRKDIIQICSVFHREQLGQLSANTENHQKKCQEASVGRIFGMHGRWKFFSGVALVLRLESMVPNADNGWLQLL
jgi:hypothetical protein